MGADYPIEMVLLIFICLFGITTTKGAYFTIKTNKYLSNFGPLLQKFHNQTKYLAVLTSYKSYIGPNFWNLEPNLVGEISVRCDKGTDCPIGLICKKNTCTKPGPSSIHLLKGKRKQPIS